MQSSKLAQYQAYALANQTAPKTRQIVMLYDGAIRFMRQAKEAIEQKRIEDRFNLLVKASDIIIGLQSCLDFDGGGEIAQTLYDYYSSIDASILSIHRSNSAEMCEAVIRQLKQMRDVWDGIDQRVEGGQVSPPATHAAPQPVSEIVAPSGGDMPTPAAMPSELGAPLTPTPLQGVEISV